MLVHPTNVAVFYTYASRKEREHVLDYQNGR